MRYVMLILALALLTACTQSPQTTPSRTKSITTASEKTRFPNSVARATAFYEILYDNLGGETKGDANAIGNYFGPVEGGSYTGFPAASKGVVSVEANDPSKAPNFLSQILAATQPGDKILVSTQSHGSPDGYLELGLSHQDLFDFVKRAVDKGALDVTLIIMACYSGGLVDLFDQSSLNLKDYQRVIIMTSSTRDQTSSSFNGSHSAFGGAIASAFQQLTTNPVQVVTLSQFWGQVDNRTQQLGGHTPVIKMISGSNQPLDNLKMFCGKNTTDPDCKAPGSDSNPSNPVNPSTTIADDLGVMLYGNEDTPRIFTAVSDSRSVSKVLLCQSTLDACRQTGAQTIAMNTTNEVTIPSKKIYGSTPVTLTTGATYSMIFRDQNGAEIAAKSFRAKKN